MMLSSSSMKRELDDDSDMVVLDPSQYYSPYMEEHKSNWSQPYNSFATMDLQSIFNLSNFQLLSQEKREELCQLLPIVDTIPQQSTIAVSPSLFIKQENPFFWNSLTEWQSMLAQSDHIEPPQISQKSKRKSKPALKKSKLSHREDSYDSYWSELMDKEKASNVAGDSKAITLKDMCRKGLIREHDVIIYKRNFSACKTIVCKSMTVIKADGLSGISIRLDGQIFYDFETPTALETKILDHHGRVAKDKRPNGNAFKSIRLVRAGKEMGRLFDIRKDSFAEL